MSTGAIIALIIGLLVVIIIVGVCIVIIVVILNTNTNEITIEEEDSDELISEDMYSLNFNVLFSH